MTKRLATIWKRFVPDRDITAYELSIVCKNLFGTWGSWDKVGFTEDQWRDLDLTVARHFKDVEK